MVFGHFAEEKISGSQSYLLPLSQWAGVVVQSACFATHTVAQI